MNADVALILLFPLCRSSVKTTPWTSFSTMQDSNSASSASKKSFHRFRPQSLKNSLSCNGMLSGGSLLLWKWPRVKYLYSRSKFALGFHLKSQRIRVAPFLVTSCNRSDRLVDTSGRPSRVWRSTVSSAMVDRFTEVWPEEFLGLERSTVDRWICPVDFFFLDSAVDRSQHGGRPFPYFSATFTSTND